MPRYEHLCDACATTFTLTRAIADRDLPAACPACGADAPRVLSIPIVGQAAPRQANGALARPADAPPKPKRYHEGHSHGPGTRLPGS